MTANDENLDTAQKVLTYALGDVLDSLAYANRLLKTFGKRKIAASVAKSGVMECMITCTDGSAERVTGYWAAEILKRAEMECLDNTANMAIPAPETGLERVGTPKEDQDSGKPVASAYRDAEGWVLMDAEGEPVCEWPKDWPEKVNAAFIRAQGIKVAP